MAAQPPGSCGTRAPVGARGASVVGALRQSLPEHLPNLPRSRGEGAGGSSQRGQIQRGTGLEQSHGRTGGSPARPGQDPREGERWPRRRVGVRVGVNLAPAGLGKRAGAGEEPCQRSRRHRAEQGGTKAGSGRVAGRQRWARWMRLSRRRRHRRAQQHQRAPGPGAFVRRWAPGSDCRAAPSVRHRRPSMPCPSGGKVPAEVSEGQPRLSGFGIQH